MNEKVESKIFPKKEKRHKKIFDKFFIYLITNLINQKIYIGQTNNPSQRWSQHKSTAKNYNLGKTDYKNCIVIDRAIAKHNFKNFTYEIIATCKNQDDVNYIEEVIVAQYDSRNKKIGYNVALGGGSGSHSPETCQKISDGLNKYYETHDGPGKGILRSQEVKQKMSIALKGKPGTRNNIPFAIESKLKLSKSKIGHCHESARKFSKEVELKICGLYITNKYSMASLSKEFKCSPGLVRDILYRGGVKKQIPNNNSNKIFSLELENEICNLYLTDKITMKDISLKFVCSGHTIKNILIRHNIL